MYELDAPATLIASCISASLASNGESTVDTVIATCASPCPTDSVYPEYTITHRDGSSWGGQHTVSGTTTSWGCRLGDENGAYDQDPRSANGGSCYHVTAGPGEKLEHNGTSTDINRCWREIRSRQMLVRAGLDEWHKVMPAGAQTVPPRQAAEEYSAFLKSENCLAVTGSKAIAGTAPATTTTEPLKTGSAAGQSAATSTKVPGGARAGGRRLFVLGVPAVIALLHLHVYLPYVG